MKDPITYQASSHAIEIISDVLDKLLTVGIADPGMCTPMQFLGTEIDRRSFVRPKDTAGSAGKLERSI